MWSRVENGVEGYEASRNIDRFGLGRGLFRID